MNTIDSLPFIDALTTISYTFDKVRARKNCQNIDAIPFIDFLSSILHFLSGGE